MRINTNIASLTAQEASVNTNKSLSSSLEKLGSGLRINKASDDASGLAIADKLRTQASSLGQGISNANSASALIQIADKAMAEQSNILDTVKTKLIQAGTDTTSSDGRAAINADIGKLLTQFDAIATQTNYNGTNLLNTAQTLTFQVGEDTAYDITLTTAKASNTTSLGGTGTAGVTSVGSAGTATIQEATANTEMVATFADSANMTGTSFAGSFDSLTVSAVTTTLTANDAATAAIFDSLVGAGKMTETGDVYTFAATTDTAIGGQDLNFTINNLNANTDTLTFGTAGAVTVTNSDVNTTIALTNAVGTTNLGTIKGAGTLSSAEANSYMAVVDTALTELNTNRSEFGSSQIQLDSAIRSMQTTQVNLKAAESVIRDVDYAEESANFNKQNIIAQAGTYAMSQANAMQQNVMRLLQ